MAPIASGSAEDEGEEKFFLEFARCENKSQTQEENRVCFPCLQVWIFPPSSSARASHRRPFARAGP